jgi:hypothetical protein
VASTASAFVVVPSVSRPSLLTLQASVAPTNDSLGNNIAVKNLLLDVEGSGLLTKVAQSGLLSKAKAAGLSMSKAEELLSLAADYPEVLVIVEASGPEVLPLLPKLVALAPAALPFVGPLLSIKAGQLQAVAVLSVAAAAGAVVLIPDDTTTLIALQTFLVGVLGVAAPAASIAGSVVLKKLFE